MSKLTHEQLLNALHYNPETGHFTWRTTRSSNAVSGSRAGTNVTNGYRQINFSGKRYLEHRLAWFYVHGHEPTMTVDHINMVRSDNRISNLRVVTIQENTRNQPSHRDGKKTGVSWHRDVSKWRAYITIDRKFIHLGLFDDYETAVNVRSRAEKAYF